MAELFVVNGICGGTVFLLPDVPTVLGRSAECHVQVADPWISSMHALFERRGDQLWVVDLDSRNGTFVGDTRVHEAPLAPGSQLRFGKTAAELRVPTDVLEPSGILSDQRTVIRYIADLSADVAGVRERTAAPEPPPAAPAPAAPSAPPATAEAPLATLRPAPPSPATGRRHVAVLNEIGRKLLGAERLPDALARLVGVLGPAVRAESASVLLMDERGEMVPVVSEPPDAPAPVSATVVQAALRSRAGILTLDALQDLRFAASQSVIAQGIRSCICAPIWAGNRTLGAVLLARGYIDPFTADDLELATLAGFQAALAVERARIAERLRASDEVRWRLARYLGDAAAAPLVAPDVSGEPLEPAARDGVAVLALALEGAGALAAACPPREVAERVAAVQRAAADAALSHGAAVDARVDGGVVAIFGFVQPAADAADHALAAGRAALAAAAALEASAAGPRLGLRGAVERGRVVAGNFGAPDAPELRVAGEAVEAAVRLASTARAGELLVGPGAKL